MSDLPVHPWSGFYSASGCRSDGAQIFGRGLARLSINDNLVGNLLPLIEVVHSGAFDRADVYEHILGAVIRLDEAEAFLAVEPFHGSLCHMSSFKCVFRCVCMRPRVSATGSFEFWEKVVSPSRMIAARPSRSAESRLQ